MFSPKEIIHIGWGSLWASVISVLSAALNNGSLFIK